MKKTYSKPDIFFEDFSLSTNIAAGCEWIPTNATDTNCYVDYLYGRQHLILLVDPNVCAITIVDGENEYDNLCYHVPYAGNNVFNS